MRLKNGRQVCFAVNSTLLFYYRIKKEQDNVDTGSQTTVYKEKENDISGLEGTSIVILDWAMLLWYERESVRALYIDYEIRSVA